MLGSSPGSVLRHLMLEDKAILQVLERPPPSINMALDFVGSPVQRGCGGSPRLKCPDLRLMSPKPFPQCFLQQVTGLGVLLHPFFLCFPSLEVQP